MKEYNWREERKKYQSSINKTEDAPEVKPAAQNAVPAPTPASARNKGLIIAVSAIVAAAVVVIVFMMTRTNVPAAPIPAPAPVQQIAAGQVAPSLPDQPGASQVAAPRNISFGPKDSALMLQKQAEKHQHSVGVVANCIEMKDGRKFIIPCGTAWAFDTNKFATNAHVALAIKNGNASIKTKLVAAEIAAAAGIPVKDIDSYIEKIGKEKATALIQSSIAKVMREIRSEDAIIMINGAAGESYSISHVQLHRNYGITNTKVNPDVAVFTIHGHHKSYFKIADQDKLYSLKSGIAVAFLGFPTELLDSDNLNIESPVATMQTGIITSVSDFYYKDSGVRNNQLIRHNLPATGGASGSPIFNADGEVIALLYAINIVPGVQTTAYGTLLRIPSAAQINFGIRADLLRGMGRAMTLKEFFN